eukprot:2777026-Rhodomonas_salina.1
MRRAKCGAVEGGRRKPSTTKLPVTPRTLASCRSAVCSMRHPPQLRGRRPLSRLQPTDELPHA